MRESLKQVTINDLQSVFNKAVEEMCEVGSKNNELPFKTHAGITKPIVKRKAKEGERIVITNPHLSGNIYGLGDVFEVVEVVFGDVMIDVGVGLYPIKDEEYEVIIEENTEKTTLCKESLIKKNSTMILPQSEESLNTENKKSEAVQYIEDTSRLFARLYAKHGDYFMKEYEPHHQVMLDLFTALDTQELKDALRLSNNIFKGCIEKELKKRRFRAEILRVRGKLYRTEGKLCLI